MNVQELLESKQIHFIPKGKDFVVRCLNPEHEDRNPSMRIDQIDGRFNCFSCEFKGNLFTHFGEKFGGLQIQRELLVRKIQEKRAESVGLTMPIGYMPYVGNLRGIAPRTYKKFEAFEHTGKGFENRINFPIKDLSGKIVAFQGRHTGGGVPKYLFTPRGASFPLFPKVTPRRGEVILVEGIFDMLNLHDKGLENTVCCFGTNNVNEDKLAILRMQGVTHITIFFDRDEAGQKAAITIKSMGEKLGLVVRIQELGTIKASDPGDLNEEQIRKLEKKLYG